MYFVKCYTFSFCIKAIGVASQEHASFVEMVGVFLGFISIPFCWFYVAKGLQKRGWLRLVSHAVAAVLSFFSMIAIVVLFIDRGAFAVVVAGIVAAPVYFSIKPKRVGQTSEQITPSEAPQKVEEEQHRAPDPEPENKAAIDEVRKKSIEAMKHATEARERDKQARQETEPESIIGWSPVQIAESEESPPDFDPINVKSGETIAFEYVNSKNEYAQRRVVVRSCTGKTLSGICLDRQQTRTFRLDRIIGDVTSEETGEMFSPYALNVVKARARARKA